MNDTRPLERVQHSRYYGWMIHDYYGVEAYKEWEKATSKMYHGERQAFSSLVWESAVKCIE